MKYWILSFCILVFGARGWAANGPSIEDLGFDAKLTAPDAETDKTLETRARKLQLHQKLGLLTLGLVAATAATAEEGKPVPSGHENLGTLAGISYFTTAYFSLTAPEVELKAKSGWNMNLHRAMAFIHFPCMLLLPFAGKQASDAYRDGEAPSGLGKYKKDLAGAAVASLAISAISVTFDF